MVYNLKRLSANYVRGFREFVKLKELSDWTPEQQYNLFSYSLSKLYGLESAAYSKGTSTYGRSCKKYLSELKSTPKHIDKIPFAEKIQLLSMAQAYFVSVFLMKGKKEVVVDGNQKSL